MGHNTTVVVMNDALGDIERDPNFGKKLAAAVRRRSVEDCLQDVSACGHVNAATVIEYHHADDFHTILVGGNLGLDLGYAGRYDLDLASFKDKRELLKRLAKNLGVEVAVYTKVVDT